MSAFLLYFNSAWNTFHAAKWNCNIGKASQTSSPRHHSVSLTKYHLNLRAKTLKREIILPSCQLFATILRKLPSIRDKPPLISCSGTRDAPPIVLYSSPFPFRIGYPLHSRCFLLCNCPLHHHELFIRFIFNIMKFKSKIQKCVYSVGARSTSHCRIFSFFLFDSLTTSYFNLRQ